MEYKINPDIVRKYFANKKFIVRDGIRYGLDFLIYTDDPERVHSKYGVLIQRENTTYREIILAQRICTSNKKILVLVSVLPDGNLSLCECKRFIQRENRSRISSL